MGEIGTDTEAAAMPGEEYRSGYLNAHPEDEDEEPVSFLDDAIREIAYERWQANGRDEDYDALLDRMHEEYQEQRYLPDDQREDWMLSAERNAEYSRRSDETLEGVIQQHAQETWPGGDGLEGFDQYQDQVRDEYHRTKNDTERPGWVRGITREHRRRMESVRGNG